MSSIRSPWLMALRLHSLPLAFACIGMGAFLAGAVGAFSWGIFLLALLTASLLQLLSNLANDMGDTVHGADTDERIGPPRAVQTGLITKKAMSNGIILTAVLSFLSGVILLWLAFDELSDFLWFLGLGIAAMLAAVGYTLGKKPYGYLGLGDIFVFLFFGLLGVCGSAFLFIHDFSFSWFLPAGAVGFLTVAVLNVNNIRDRHSDTQTGKRTLATRLGKTGSAIYHTLLVGGAFLFGAAFIIIEKHSGWQSWLFIVLVVPAFLHVRTMWQKDGRDLEPSLKHMVLLTLFFVLFYGAGLMLS